MGFQIEGLGQGSWSVDASPPPLERAFDELESKKLLTVGFSLWKIGSVTFLEEAVTPLVRAQGHYTCS